MCFVRSSCSIAFFLVSGSCRKRAEGGGSRGDEKKRNTYPESSKGISRHFKRAPIYPVKKGPKYPVARLLPVLINGPDSPRTRPWLVTVVVQNHGRGGLAALDELFQNGARVLCAFLVVVALAQLDQDLGPSFHHVGEGKRFGAGGRVGWAEAEDVGEDDLGVFSGVEGEAVEVDGEEIEEVFFDHAGDQLVLVFEGGFLFCCRQTECWSVNRRWTCMDMDRIWV